MKIYVPTDLTEVPGGLVFRKNLIWFPSGDVLSINQAATTLHGVRFEDNLVAARKLGGHEKGARAQNYEYSGNHAVALSEAGNDSMREFVGAGGVLHEKPSDAGFRGVGESTGAIEIQPGSPAAEVGAK